MKIHDVNVISLSLSFFFVLTTLFQILDGDAYDFDLQYDFGASFYSLNAGLVHIVCLNT